MTYALIAQRTANLSSDFGAKMAERYFTEETISQLGQFVKGKKKGKSRGLIRWKKVERGGWVRTTPATISGDSTGYVENRVGSVIEVELCKAEWNIDPEPIAHWKKEK